MTDQGAPFAATELARFLDEPCMPSVLLSAADVCIILDDTGAILSAASRHGLDMEGEIATWVGRKLADLLDEASKPKLQARLEQLAGQSTDKPKWAELFHRRQNGQSVPIRYALHRMRKPGHVLMLGHDQRPTIEMQQMLLNAQIALEHDHEAQREIDTRYRLLMDFTQDAIALISLSSGRVVDINHGAAAMLGQARADCIDRPLAEHFTNLTAEGLTAAFEAPLTPGSEVVIDVEITETQRKAQIAGKRFRASGEQLAILRLTDPDRGSVGDSRLVSNLRQLFNRGSDAIVFTDRDGNILAASETFLNLTDAPEASSVKGRSLSDFLARGVADLRLLLDNARRAGQLRMYATKLNTDFGAQVGVEVSATWLDDDFDPVLALVIRNTATAASLRSETGGGGAQEGNMQGVIELVGSSTLKDIVAETTDVIEKICIETALELSRNNRVATAEMLGLSRQSLYVKLRKYGLLSKEDG